MKQMFNLYDANNDFVETKCFETVYNGFETVIKNGSGLHPEIEAALNRVIRTPEFTCYYHISTDREPYDTHEGYVGKS